MRSQPRWRRTKEVKMEWSGLPKERWPAIGKHLNTRIDIVRFRSVCKLWRSSISPFQQSIIPPLPVSFSSSPDAEAEAESGALLLQATVYRMKPISGEPNSSNPRLVKFEESNSGHMLLVNPITNYPLRFSPICKNFSLLEFRIVELHKSYSLNFRNCHVDVARVNKVVVLGPTHLDDCAVFMIYDEGKLGFLRVGDEQWTHLDEQSSHYDDVIVYKGQCYVVDRWGTISCVNSELALVRFSPPLCGFGSSSRQKKHMVESCGDLYVVDRYLDKERPVIDRLLGFHVENNIFVCGQFGAFPNIYVRDPEAIDFKVYKLDQERGSSTSNDPFCPSVDHLLGTWVEVKNLGDQVFILGSDECFSVSTRHFGTVEGNFILYTDQRCAHLPVVGGARSCHSQLFSLEDGSIRNLEAFSDISQMFQPPSTWLSPDCCPSAC